MSIIDVLFIAIYCVCGFAARRFILPYGETYGFLGFFVGFSIPFLISRCFWRRFLKRTNDAPKKKRNGDINLR